MPLFEFLLQLKRSFMWPQDKDKDKVLELYIANDNSQVGS